MQNEMHDPEMCYRRGYHQSALQVFDAIKHCLPVQQRSIVHAWIAEDVLKWRVAGLKGRVSAITMAARSCASHRLSV
jgi:hypothetical protein